MGRNDRQVSLASFTLLLSEMIAYSQRRVTGISDLEKKWDLPFIMYP